MNNITTSEVLDLAADEIQRRGWTTGPNGWNADGPVCIEGAIAAVANIERIDIGMALHPNVRLLHECPAYVAVREYLSLLSSEPVYMYNDHIAKDEEEVVAVLRAAAAVERAKEAACAPEKVAA